MKVTRISTGNYKVVTGDGSYIVRSVQSWNGHSDRATQYWVANNCETLSECHDDNSCCEEWSTLKAFKSWAN